MRLIAHINGDDDILDAWFRHYATLGVSSFHLVVHGPDSENQRLASLIDDYPITVEEQYQGEFTSTLKLEKIQQVAESFRGEWLVWVDSDEFLQLPLWHDLGEAVGALESLHTDVLRAPMLQRLTSDGSLSTPETISDPFATFPLGSCDLYERMGVTAAISKYPLIRYADGATLSDGGNHGRPRGYRGRLAPALGITHHFKWRQTVRRRIEERAASGHPWRHESVALASYLEEHDWKLPTDGAFICSDVELRRRGLIGPHPRWKYFARWALSRLPTSVDDRMMNLRHHK